MKKCSWCGKEYLDEALFCATDGYALQPVARSCPPILTSAAGERQHKEDGEHIKLLAIFHFVVAGLAFLGIVFLFFSLFHVEHLLLKSRALEVIEEHDAPVAGVFCDLHLVLFFYGGTTRDGRRSQHSLRHFFIPKEASRFFPRGWRPQLPAYSFWHYSGDIYDYGFVA